MEQREYIEHLQEQINQIIGTKSILKRRKKTDEDTQRELFVNVIPLLEHIAFRNAILFADYGIEMAKYEEMFFQVIDGLIYMTFGKEAGDVIMFYVYERINPDGTINPLMDNTGSPIPLNSIEDLWELIKRIKAVKKKKDA